MNLDPSKRKALVLDDHRLFSETLSIILEKSGTFRSVQGFSDITKLHLFLIHNNVNNAFLFVDYYLRNATITAHINQLEKMGKGLKIIIVSCISNPILIHELAGLGVHGIISKNAPLTEIKTCIQFVASGKQYFSPFISSILSNYKELPEIVFTIREVEILGYFAKGYTVDKTSELLNLSRHTIAAHRRKMMAKINCNNIIELLNYARSRGLIESQNDFL